MTVTMGQLKQVVQLQHIAHTRRSRRQRQAHVEVAHMHVDALLAQRARKEPRLEAQAQGQPVHPLQRARPIGAAGPLAQRMLGRSGGEQLQFHPGQCRDGGFQRQRLATYAAMGKADRRAVIQCYTHAAMPSFSCLMVV